MYRHTWRVPVVVFVAAMLVLSACSGGQRVTVFPFSTGADAKGFEALAAVFQERYPSIRFVNAAAAVGPGVDPRFMLDTLVEAGETPDSWQARAGRESTDAFVPTGRIRPLNDLYEAEGWSAVLPEALLPLLSRDGNIYSVPVNVHRVNVLWYNPALLEANGLSLPATMGDWFLAMDTLKTAGVTPLALGGPDTQLVLLETILLGTLGPEKYSGLWDGSTDWGGADVKSALDNFQIALGYANADFASLAWQDAVRLVANGGAAFVVMSDEADGIFRGMGKTLNTGYAWEPVPGSGGAFQFYADSFVLANNALDEKSALAWLEVVGSKVGQDAYNVAAGSMCARTDCSASLFNGYVQEAMTDWLGDAIVGSLAYGVAAGSEWRSAIEAALAAFIQDGKVEAFQFALTAACRSAGPCP